MELKNGLPVVDVTLISMSSEHRKNVQAILSTGNVVSRFKKHILQKLQYENINKEFPCQITIEINGTDNSKLKKIIDVIECPDEEDWRYDYDVVIGLDVLKDCSHFIINGPSQEFELQFK